MSLERILKALNSLGLRQYEAELYVYIAKNGPIKAEEIAKTFSPTNSQIYHALKKLRKKHLVKANYKSTVEFIAIDFEIALDLFANTKKETARQWERDREKILIDWHSLLLSNNTSST